MKNTAVSERYAQALFELATEKNTIEAIKEELISVSGAIKEYPEFENLLFHPVINPQDKKAMLEGVFKDKVSDVSLNFLKFLVDKKREALIQEISDLYTLMVNNLQRKVVAEVYTAVEIGSAELDLLRQKLESYLDKKVDLENHVDQNVVGGVLVKIGDRVIDGTLKTRFENMARSLR